MISVFLERLLFSALLAASAVIGLRSKTEKRVKLWLMINRIFEVIFIIFFSVSAVANFHTAPMAAILVAILIVFLIAVTELGFARKQETTVAAHTYWLIFTSIILILLTSFL